MGGRVRAAAAAHPLRRGDGSLVGSDKPDLRFGLELGDLTDAPARDRVQRLPRRDRRRAASVKGMNAGAREMSRARARRARRRGEGARREGPGLGGRRGRWLALAGGEVPLRRRARGDQRAPRGVRGTTCCCSPPTSGNVAGDGPRRAADPARRALRADPRRGQRARLDRRLAAVRVERRTRSAGTRCTTRSPLRPARSTPTTRARPARSPTTSPGTASSSAAARSVSPIPRSSGRCSPRWGSRAEDAEARFGFLLGGASATALRRTVASPTGSTAWSRSCTAPTRSAT